MASWEDGPEFAPEARPAAFRAPRVSELPRARPVVSPADGAPVDRPADFTQPDAPVPALTSLAPAPSDPRDPTAPFAVGSMTLTQDTSAWGAAHSSVLEPAGRAAGPGFDPTRPLASERHTAPPPSFPPPMAPVTSSPPPPGSSGGQPQSGPVQAVFTALTPGVAVSLLVGCFVPLVSTVTFIIALAFSFRVQQGQPAVRTTMMAGAGALAFGGLIGLAATGGDFAAWWMMLGWTALVVSWVALAICVAFVHRALRGNAPRTPF